MLWLFGLEYKQNNSSNSFRMRIFLFLSYSFGIEMITIFIDSVESHTWFKTKMPKVYTRFWTKTAQKPYPITQHIAIWLVLVSTSRLGIYAKHLPGTALIFSTCHEISQLKSTFDCLCSLIWNLAHFSPK